METIRKLPGVHQVEHREDVWSLSDEKRIVVWMNRAEPTSRGGEIVQKQCRPKRERRDTTRRSKNNQTPDKSKGRGDQGR